MCIRDRRKPAKAAGHRYSGEHGPTAAVRAGWPAPASADRASGVCARRRAPCRSESGGRAPR
eukprot:4719650-Alexandrium_andersonii.AAC.1